MNSTILANQTFIPWIFQRLLPATKALPDVVDMTTDQVMKFGDAVVGCNYRKKITIGVPSVQCYTRYSEDSGKGATFHPILEDQREQIVHLLSGDYFQSLEVIIKKSGQLQTRFVYVDPPWGFHSTKAGGPRKEDEFLEPPDRVC